VFIKQGERMSNTTTLRQTHSDFGGGQTIFSKGARDIEANLNSVVPLVMEQLKEDYPHYTIEHHKNIRKDSSFYDLMGYELHNPNANIKPDGGMITVNGYPVFFGEVKNQGTNHLRKREGLPRQSMGNGIERIYKNIVEISHIMKNYDCVPYVIFVQGSDFHQGSSIIDRLSMLSPFNQLKTTETSVFIKINDNWDDEPKTFSAAEMYDITLERCKESLVYYKARSLNV
jgi:hypothetical protein